jgi:putative FmdB family regulatory protein
MPKYIYRCDICATEDLEVEHPITEDPEIMCDCGAERRRVPQAPGITFKGYGFYRTDQNKEQDHGA